jgi:hypothetical protein
MLGTLPGLPDNFHLRRIIHVMQKFGRRTGARRRGKGGSRVAPPGRTARHTPTPVCPSIDPSIRPSFDPRFVPQSDPQKDPQKKWQTIAPFGGVQKKPVGDRWDVDRAPDHRRTRLGRGSRHHAEGCSTLAGSGLPVLGRPEPMTLQ